MGKIIQFNIRIVHSSPSIWRSFQIMDDYRLDHFHQVLQIVMGWDNYHLHRFTIQGKHYEMNMPHIMNLYEEGENEVKYFLHDFNLQQNEEIAYLYDFGDSWEHLIEVEDIIEGELIVPICLAGKNAGPREDSGGIHHYQHLVKIIKNPSHPDYEEFKTWLPENFDATLFDILSLNKELKRFGLFRQENPDFKSSPWQMVNT